MTTITPTPARTYLTEDALKSMLRAACLDLTTTTAKLNSACLTNDPESRFEVIRNTEDALRGLAQALHALIPSALLLVPPPKLD